MSFRKRNNEGIKLYEALSMVFSVYYVYILRQLSFPFTVVKDRLKLVNG